MMYKFFACFNKNLNDFDEFYQYANVYSTCMVCDREDEVFLVTLEECTKDEYDFVGWKDYKNSSTTNNVDFIYKKVDMLRLVFPYLLENYIKKGDGDIVYLKVIETKSMGLAKNIDSSLESILL